MRLQILIDNCYNNYGEFNCINSMAHKMAGCYEGNMRQYIIRDSNHETIICVRYNSRLKILLAIIVLFVVGKFNQISRENCNKKTLLPCHLTSC